MTLRVVTAPAESLLEIEQLRLHCSLQGVTDWDTLLASLLAAAVSRLESATQRRFLTQDLEWSRPGWCGEFRLPVAPVAVDGVTAVVYIDANGDEQTLSPSLYVVSPCGPTVTIRPLQTASWPVLDPDAAEPVIIRFAAGDAVADLEPNVSTAAAMLVAHMFANRGDADVPAMAPSNLPLAVEALIASERWD